MHEIDNKKLYADAMIRQGNLFFNRGEYEAAAKQYEKAAQWSRIELLDEILILLEKDRISMKRQINEENKDFLSNSAGPILLITKGSALKPDSIA